MKYSYHAVSNASAIIELIPEREKDPFKYVGCDVVKILIHLYIINF